MPAPAHVRVTFSGVFGSPTQPTEIWAFNLNAVDFETDSLAVLQTQADNCRAAFNTHLKPIYDTDVTLTRTRVARVDATGHVRKTAGGGYLQADNVVTVAGANGAVAANRKPLQTAMCVSLLTARAGATGKGRFFLPWPSAQLLESDYRISAAQAGANATTFAAFVTAVSVAVQSNVVVASGGSLETGAPPTLSVVNSVRVGRVPDTMRSRRSNLLEAYASANVSA